MTLSISLRHFVKRGLQHVAAKFGPHIRNQRDPQLLVLMYHRVLPADDPRSLVEEPGMQVTPKTFKKNLEIASRHFEFIKISDWVERKSQGLPLPPKACAVTFDDGWADNYEFAFPILKEMAIPATIFLVSDMIGTRKLFWPERMSRILSSIAENHSTHWNDENLKWLKTNQTKYAFGNIPPDSEELSQIIDHAKTLSDSDIHHRLDQIEQTLDIDTDSNLAALLDWTQVNHMQESQLIEFGSHTCHHTRLTANTPVEVLRSEIDTSKTTIEKQTGAAVKTFCFPNGDYSPQALEFVRRNYTGAVTTNSGWNSAITDSHLLHRIGIHEDIARDKTAFLARISGWL